MKRILVTGANGEIGHSLISKFSQDKRHQIVALDLADLDSSLKEKVHTSIRGDILDEQLLTKLFKTYKFDIVFHLAALLSTASERNSLAAHNINTTGSLNLLSNAAENNTIFIFPSSIAVYGISDKKRKKVKEEEYNNPTTMYGCNKLYVELLGNYYNKSKHFNFRAVRFPGIISAETMPTGGTSDFGPEMLHAAAQQKDYECFVRPDTKIPFIVMPDAVKALLSLAFANGKQIKRYVYNVGSFSISAKEIEKYAKKLLHSIKITYKPDRKRQAIVDSWPEDVDDSKARKDWGWAPDFNEKRAFEKYLIPMIKKNYI